MDRIRFLLDEHIPRAVAQGLRRRGIDVLTADEAHLLGAGDADFLECGREQARVVVTHDGDFLLLHRQQAHAGIVYSRQGERSIGQLIAGLVLVYEVLEPGGIAGRVEYL